MTEIANRWSYSATVTFPDGATVTTTITVPGDWEGWEFKRSHRERIASEEAAEKAPF